MIGLAILLVVIAVALLLLWIWMAPQVRAAFAPAVEKIDDVRTQIEQMLGGDYYARHSHREWLVDQCTQALKVTRQLSWKLFASGAQKASAAVIDGFAARSEQLVAAANQRFVNDELVRCRELFDRIESKPLTLSQRRACVICEDNNLVLAGAGTGKTSTMTGRAAYLVAGGFSQPQHILMIAYARKAAQEMQERQDGRLKPLLGSDPPKIKTFHALGLEIISAVEGRRPTVTRLAEDSFAFGRFIDEKIQELCETRDYKAKLVQYFGSERYPYRNPFDFGSKEEYLEYVRTNELRTLSGEVVKSFEECVIANFLSAYGIRYEYEAAYQVDTAGPDYRQYTPDFFLPDYGIYIEHFAINRQGKPPPHFENASAYSQGIEWKRKTHAKNQTTLIETYSYLKREGKLESSLYEQLAKAGVRLERKSDEELLQELRDSTLVSEFAALLGEFLSNFKDCGMDLTSLRQAAATHPDASRLCLVLDLFAPVLQAYGAELRQTGHVDFADMIRKATSYVESEAFKSPYTHIMVDEFQDISRARAGLVNALKRQRSDAVLFAVGDDWQSIYRFSGSDIRFTKDFAAVFGPTATTTLDLTFRFNDQIGLVASTFVLKNPSQIRKEISSALHCSTPAVSLVRVLQATDGLNLALEAISSAPGFGYTRRASVLVLGRYNFSVDDWRTSTARRRFRECYPLLDVDFMTVHSAKGKEADFVVIVGLNKGKHGFPSEKPTDALLEFLLPEKETFPLAEERRLFYVALTRARHRAYLVYNPLEASTFVKEVTREPRYSITRDEFTSSLILQEQAHVACPACGMGDLHVKQGRRGAFVGCNHYPYCKYTERPCPQCGGLMRREGSARRCTVNQCNGVVPICQKCGGSMVERSGPYGRFWGCSNYRAAGDFICTNTLKIPPKTIRRR